MLAWVWREGEWLRYVKLIQLTANTYQGLPMCQALFCVPHAIAILTTVPWNRYYHFLRFTEQEIEAQGGQVTFPSSSETWSKDLSLSHRVPSLVLTVSLTLEPLINHERWCGFWSGGTSKPMGSANKGAICRWILRFMGKNKRTRRAKTMLNHNSVGEPTPPYFQFHHKLSQSR